MVRWFKKKPKAIDLNIELNFNRDSLHREVRQLVEPMIEHEREPGTKAFENFVVKMLNLELLNLSSGKLEETDYAYRKGRVDALQNLLHQRSTFIEDDKRASAKAKDQKKSSDNNRRTSNYLTQSTAGLA